MKKKKTDIKRRAIKYDGFIIDRCIKALDMANVNGHIEDIVFDITDEVARNICTEIDDILRKVRDPEECCAKIEDYCLSVLCSEEEIDSYNYSLENKKDDDAE